MVAAMQSHSHQTETQWECCVPWVGDRIYRKHAIQEGLARDPKRGELSSRRNHHQAQTQFVFGLPSHTQAGRKFEAQQKCNLGGYVYLDKAYSMYIHTSIERALYGRGSLPIRYVCSPPFLTLIILNRKFASIAIIQQYHLVVKIRIR